MTSSCQLSDAQLLQIVSLKVSVGVSEHVKGSEGSRHTFFLSQAPRSALSAIGHQLEQKND